MTDFNIPNPTPTSPDPMVPSAPVSEPSALDAALDSIFGEVGGDKKGGSGTPAEFNKDFPGTGGSPDWTKLGPKFQSDYDRTAAELKKVNELVQQQYQPLVEFYNELYDNEEVREAFIGELAPDLVKAKDPHSFIKERLAKEFGEDFDPESTDDKLKARMYNVRVDQLLRETLDKQTKVPKTLKQIREERKQKAESQQREAVVMKQDIMSKLSWDDNSYNSWLEWAQKIKPMDLAKLKDRLDKQAKKSTTSFPHLGNVQGGAPVSANQFKQELDAFFGPN
jgi:hypothetical protein